MNKRQFIRTLAAGGLGILSGSLTAGWRFRRPHGTGKHKNWVWITTDDERPDEEWKKEFATIRAAGINAVLPEIYNGSFAFYGSAHLPVKSRWLERIIPLAHAEGLEVHAWMWTMPCNIDQIVTGHPDWYSVNRKGESASDKPAYVPYYKFLCPSHPEVRQFVQTTVRELSEIGGLDGVHLDYVRYPDVILAEGLQPKYHIAQDREYPEYDYCYCDVCKADFKKETGIDLSSLLDPTSSKEWRQFRYDRITRLVNDDLIPVILKGGKAATAAVFPNWQNVRQEWSRWNLDAALPMLYHGFYNKDIAWIGEMTAEEIKALHKPIPVYSGLFVPQLKPDSLAEAVTVALGSGAGGVSLFALQMMTGEHWEQFEKAFKE